MQKIITKTNVLTLEDKLKLVGAFAWLLQEDKKQNPALYKIKKIQNNDRHDMPSYTEGPDAIPHRSI